MDTNVQSWATAISTHLGSGRKIIWRFAKDLSPTFDSKSLPDRIIIVWRYESDSGQPVPEDHARMNVLEDLLEPVTEDGRLATLALVSTGEGLREWTYYTRSGDEFIDRLNQSLFGQPLFPIEIQSASDPTWSMYREFRGGVTVPPN